MKIPQQLRNLTFKFVRLGKWNLYRNSTTKEEKVFYPSNKNELNNLIKQGWKPMGKAPQDTAWQEINNFAYNSPLITEHKGNIGIATGFGQLAILDDDTPNKILLNLFIRHFGETFRVRDHLYIILEGLDEKIIFYDFEKLNEKGDPTHLGELQFKGQQCVTYPSIHPLGEQYKITNDCEIKKIDFKDFKKAFEKYIPKPREIINRPKKEIKGELGTNVSDLRITDIISTAGFRKVKGGMLGEHPQHGATNGGNFLINDDNATWTCFRCNSGKNSHCGCGDVWALIAVLEGIISCSNAGPRCLTKEQAFEVVEIAREKYGLKPQEQEQPKGWAKSLSITHLAQKYNLQNCPQCNNPFSFNENNGMYYCKSCKYGGGIRKFAQLIIKKGNCKMNFQEIKQ